MSNKECAGVLWSLESCAFLSPQRHSFGYCNLQFVPTEEPSAASARLPFLLFPQQQPRSINIHEHHSDKQQQQYDMTWSRWLTKGHSNRKDAGFGVSISQLVKSKFNMEVSDLEKWFSLTQSSLHSESWEMPIEQPCLKSSWTPDIPNLDVMAHTKADTSRSL